MTRSLRVRPVPVFLLAVALLPATLLAAPAPAQAPQPGTPAFIRYVLERLDDQHRGDQSHGVMEMKVNARHWTRTVSLESWTRGKDYSLVRVLSPEKEKGTSTLKSGTDLFTYLSKTGRTVKISGGMMGGSWMGSHFTNDDLVRETRLSDDYDARQLADADQDGTPVHRFELTPRPDRPVVWGKVVVTVRTSDLLPLGQTFFDEDGKPVRSLEMRDPRVIEGRTLPMVLVMRPLDGSGEFTQVTFKQIRFDVKLDPEFFSLQKLRAM